MGAKRKGSVDGAARLKNKNLFSENTTEVEYNSSGILRPLDPVVITGTFRKRLVDYLNDCRQRGLPGGHTLTYCTSVFSADTDLILDSGQLCFQFALCNWRPLPRISVQTLVDEINEINNSAYSADRVAEALERRGGRTLLTAANPVELLKDMRSGLERGNRLAHKLVARLEDPRNWVNSVPDNLLIIGRARLTKEVSE
jgi:hypothetical protein